LILLEHNPLLNLIEVRKKILNKIQIKILKIGLEYLLQVDKLKVKQLASTVEALTGWDTNNKYEIFNSDDQKIFFAVESRII